MAQDVLDQEASWVRKAKRDFRGRIEVYEKASGKTIQRLPVDVLDGLRRGLFLRPEDAPKK